MRTIVKNSGEPLNTFGELIDFPHTRIHPYFTEHNPMEQPTERGIPAPSSPPGHTPNYLLQISPDDLSDIIRRNVAAVLEERLPPDLNERVAAIQEHITTATAANLKDYLTRRETAALLHITPATLHGMEKRRELLPVRIGRRVLYRRNDIEKALRGG